MLISFVKKLVGSLSSTIAAVVVVSSIAIAISVNAFGLRVSGGLALYFVIWWITLFAVLPFGIRSQHETGEVIEGTEPGAPVLPGLLKKAAITSVIAAVIFAGVWYVWVTYDI